MREHELRAALRSVDVPEGSREHAAGSIRSAMPSRRRWRIPIAGAIALVTGFALTAPGQATVAWVTEAVHLKQPADSAWHLNSATVVGSGVSPAGHRYEVSALPTARSGVCLMFKPPPEESPQPSAVLFTEATCEHFSEPEEPQPRTTYFPLNDGGVGAFGLIDPAASSVHVTLEDGSEVDADLIHVAGDVEAADGGVEPIAPMAAFVVFLPPGAGDVASGPPVTLEGSTDTGAPLLPLKLSWAKATPGQATIAADCTSAAEPLNAICEDARTGELGRVDESLAAPLPPEVADALSERGYSYVPATDDEREMAAEPDFELVPRSPLSMSAWLGLGYEAYLGRLSGRDLSDRLVYILPAFPERDLPQPTGNDDPQGPPEVGAFVVDAMSGETLDNLGAAIQGSGDSVHIP